MLATLLIKASLLGMAATNAPQVAGDLKSLEGEWIYVEDRTPDRPLEQMGAPMTSKFSFAVVEGAVILVRGHGSGNENVRVSLDGTATDVPAEGNTRIARYTGSWKDGAFSYRTDFIKTADNSPDGYLQKAFVPTTDGLIVPVSSSYSPGSESIGLYRHVKDIPMPTPFEAKIGDISWLSDSWVGTRGATGAIKMEERWGPPSGGAILGVSRSVSNGRMTSFEYLRIIERKGGLVYIAQPGGGAATEFVLTELSSTKAVFDNPRHDYPKRIMYELSSDGKLTATVGYAVGGTPRRYEYTREGS